MAPRLVNTVPGPSSEALRPDHHIHLGLKSETLGVQLPSIRIDTAMSALHQVPGQLPETDSSLKEKGLLVSLETSERRRPLAAPATRTPSGTGFVLTKTQSSYEEPSVYELRIPIQRDSSLFARVKLKKGSWVGRSPDWTNLSGVVAPFIGLEHSVFNSAAFVFLRNNGSGGSLVLGGPLQNFGQARPGQLEAAFPWVGFSQNDSFEIFLYYNMVGRPPPFSAPYIPLVEVWVKGPNDSAPSLVHTQVAGGLGQFPNPANSSFPNWRESGGSDTATLYIGNLGGSGESVVVEDWELYPDYRYMVLQGRPLPDTEFNLLPDAPISFHARDGFLPNSPSPLRWLSFPGGMKPSSRLHYNPGRRTSPVFAVIDKPLIGLSMAFYRQEPVLEQRDSGVLLEGFISGESTGNFGATLGMGLGVEDGEKLYQAVFVTSGGTRSIGITRSLESVDNPLTGFHLPQDGGSVLEVDHRSLKFVRLLVDRLRDKVSLFVEDEDQPVLTKQISDEYPSSSGKGQVLFGHIQSVPTGGGFQAASISYVPRYYAWEGVDGFLPTAAEVNDEVRFSLVSSGAGGATVAAGSLLIEKTDDLLSGSKWYFKKPQLFTLQSGVQVDFRVGVQGYKNSSGIAEAPLAEVGVGVRLHLAGKLLYLGFYDCGIHGKKVAILPGSGTPQDILIQTELGRSMSASVDFSTQNTYRLVYQAFGRIELWVGTLRNSPLISIPWRNDTEGFDLPVDLSSEPAISFGHFNESGSSSSIWDFVRWGRSSGYEVSARPLYKNGYPKFMFGGRTLVRSDFEEQ